MEEDAVLPLGCEHELMCTENREFLYDSDTIAVNPDLVFQNARSNMAGARPDLAFGPDEKEKPGKKPPTPKKPTRKRNSLRDRLRNEAEQNAYKHLREIIPSLQTVKKPTKLETVRNACQYIESLQKTIMELEGHIGLM